MKHVWYVLNNDAISNMMVMLNFFCSTYFRVDFLKACFLYIVHVTTLSLPSQVFLVPLALSCSQHVVRLILGQPILQGRIPYLGEQNYLREEPYQISFYQYFACLQAYVAKLMT